MNTKHIAILQLGSNQGDRLNYIEESKNIIAEFSTIELVGSTYETEAWGNTNQASFFNQIVEIHTVLDPFTLLNKCLETEEKIGRIRKVKWGPRVIDIDILFFDKKIIWTKSLTIPHPFIQNRRFVLEPLKEHWNDFEHPFLHQNIEALHEDCSDTLQVKKLS